MSKAGKCYAFYKKVKKDENLCTVMGWCGKETKTVYQTLAHVEYMDRWVPNWLDDEETYKKLSFPEASTKLLIPLEKKDSELHDIIFDELQQLSSIKERTGPETRRCILAHRRNKQQQESAYADYI